MIKQTSGNYLVVIALVAVVGVAGYYVLNMPDNRTAGEKIGDAIDELGDRTPGERINDAVKSGK